MNFRALEEFGRIPLSKHFAMRQFLYSEIFAVYGIPNVPDDLELALRTGTRLCEEILEPIVDMFGLEPKMVSNWVFKASVHSNLPVAFAESKLIQQEPFALRVC